MPDIEKARRELRFAKSSADDKRWDQLESRLQVIDAALEGAPDAEKAPIAAEVAAMREKMRLALREEKAGRIEREIKRSLSAAADDLNRGYDESPQLPKAVARLDSAEAKEVLAPETVAALQAEIAALQARSKKGAPPPPPKPAPTSSSAELEKARRELRSAKMTADDKRWDQLEPKLQAVEAALKGAPDAGIAAEVAALRETMRKAVREEKAARIEREIKRELGAAADELGRGYDESPRLPKAVERLASAEAKEVLSSATVAALQAEIAALQARSKKPASPLPPGPAPAAPPPPAATAPPSPSKPAAAPVVENERAKAVENDLARTLRFAADDVGRDTPRVASAAERVLSKLEDEEVRQILPPETAARLRAQAEELKAKAEAEIRQDKIRTLEGFIERFLRNAEDDLSRAEGMLRNAAERIERDDAKKLLSAESIARFKSAIKRVEGLVAAAEKKDGLDRALPVLQELEEKVKKPIFDDSQPAWRALGDLEALKSRVRGALYKIPKDDADVKAVEKRIGVVDDEIATACAKLDREQAHERVKQAFDADREAVAGWEEEKAGEDYDLPKTALALRRLGWFLEDKEIRKIGEAHKGDAAIQALLGEARKIRDAALAKLQAAFDKTMARLDKAPRPSSRFDLEKPWHLSGRAASDFEGTPDREKNVARAKALGDRWQAEIEADRKARQAKYDEASVLAAEAWPRIRAGIAAETEFDPERSKGKTVLVEGLRNRIGWDFGGPYDFAIWVGNVPVIGNYDKNVLEAANRACEKIGLPLDDHTDWDAVLVLGGPGKIKLRTEIVIRDRGNLEIGKVEEWRPVDAVTCTVIALRAGPVAVGPRP